MIIHYLKITWRNLSRRAGFSFINLLGLSVGLTAFIYLAQYISFEKGFNQAFTNLDQLHRVVMVGTEHSNPLSPSALAPAIQTEQAHVQAYSRILDNYNGVITFQHNGALQTYSEDEGIYADGNLLEVLGYPFTAGISPTAPYTVAISQTKAEEFFGTNDAIGQSFTLNNQFGEQIYTISGIFPDLPTQSDFQFDLLYSIKSFENIEALNNQKWAWLGDWDAWMYQTILKVAPNADFALIQQSLSGQKVNLPEQFEGEIKLQPLSGLHLGEGPNASMPSVVNARYINFFLLLGFLILIIAWINYVNLSLAQSLQRIKSIGMQRIVGAMGRQIWGQYLVEAITFNLLAFGIAMFLVIGGQNFINTLVDRPLGFSLFEESWLLAGGLLFLLAGALFSGIYVAVVLSAFHPMAAIKGLIKQPGQKDWLRKGMLVFQFSISTGLIIGTGFMLRQLQFMQDKELGAQLDQVLLIRGPQIMGENYEGSLSGFQNELEKQPFINQISFSGLAPGEGFNFQAPTLVSKNAQPGDDQIVYASASIDDHYFELYEIPILAGRNFRPEEVTSFSWYDIEKVVLNETAVKALRFEGPEDAIGQKITWWNEKSFEVVGVVPDHHHMGLQEAIKPMVFLGTENFGLLGLKLNAEGIDENLASLATLYTESFPGNPFNYLFADENFAEQYNSQKQTAGLFGLACGLAVFIACLGLLGLSIAGVRQRTKEVGIRKVLGATVSQLTLLLAKDYLLQIMLSFLIVIPIVFYFTQQWLLDFAYRINLEWWIFALSGLFVLTLAMLTVSSQAIKVALANPTNSLRSE